MFMCVNWLERMYCKKILQLEWSEERVHRVCFSYISPHRTILRKFPSYCKAINMLWCKFCNLEALLVNSLFSTTKYLPLVISLTTYETFPYGLRVVPTHHLIIIKYLWAFVCTHNQLNDRIFPLLQWNMTQTYKVEMSWTRTHFLESCLSHVPHF